MANEIEEIVGHLGAILMQAAPADDPIIIGHVRDAHAIALRLLRSSGKVTAALQEAEEYFDDRADVIDGDYGHPSPNREMSILSEIREALGVRS